MAKIKPTARLPQPKQTLTLANLASLFTFISIKHYQIGLISNNFQGFRKQSQLTLALMVMIYAQ